MSGGAGMSSHLPPCLSRGTGIRRHTFGGFSRVGPRSATGGTTRWVLSGRGRYSRRAWARGRCASGRGRLLFATGRSCKDNDQSREKSGFHAAESQATPACGRHAVAFGQKMAPIRPFARSAPSWAAAFLPYQAGRKCFLFRYAQSTVNRAAEASAICQLSFGVLPPSKGGSSASAGSWRRTPSHRRPWPRSKPSRTPSRLFYDR
ncbi:MAG: hypothetical protein QOE70_665 [Chthoniobacter sp.]|nr:hypothetical protein [Chthoniobacter sp.]